MAVAVGIDVAKQLHRMAVVMADSGKVLVFQRVESDPDGMVA